MARDESLSADRVLPVVQEFPGNAVADNSVEYNVNTTVTTTPIDSLDDTSAQDGKDDAYGSGGSEEDEDSDLGSETSFRFNDFAWREPLSDFISTLVEDWYELRERSSGEITRYPGLDTVETQAAALMSVVPVFQAQWAMFMKCQINVNHKAFKIIAKQCFWFTLYMIMDDQMFKDFEDSGIMSNLYDEMVNAETGINMSEFARAVGPTIKSFVGFIADRIREKKELASQQTPDAPTEAGPDASIFG